LDRIGRVYCILAKKKQHLSLAHWQKLGEITKALGFSYDEILATL
jgi:hypothetical protein